MPTADPRTQSSAPPVVAIVQYAAQPDHFPGVDAALAAQSVRVIRINEWELDELDHARVGLIAIKDCESPLSLAALRWARARNVPTLLMMDGVVEYRNTFANPDAPPQFLRPAPVDAIACAGETDRAKLWSWGNVAIATGLPRIAAAFPRPLPLPRQPNLLIATARRPAFDAAEHQRLLDALRAVRAAASLTCWNNRILWRLTAGLDDELGVTNDTRPLRDSLADCSAVFTTPSTLLLEAMAARRPAAILHPHDGPLWQEAIDTFRGRDSTDDNLTQFLNRLYAPDEADCRRQARAFARMHTSGPAPADQPAARVAAAIVSLLKGELGGGPGRKRELPSIERITLAHDAGRPRPQGVRRVVSCVTTDSTPIGGVMTWSLRMSREFAQREQQLGFEFRTLIVAMEPGGWKSPDFDPAAAPGVDLCVIDPLADHHQRIETIRTALESLAPDIILPNYNDACFMAAALLRPRGIRTVAIAHADDDYYRSLASTYDTWSAAVGVSAACMQWLAPLAARGDGGGRPVEQIVYGVPVATELWQRIPGSGGRESYEPLRLAYIGRMVEEQKRITDLLLLLDELELRATPCELHLVGDGPDLASWRARLAQRTHTHTRVIFHGRRSPAWVEQFLPAMDACVLVSAYEGTSVVMLEAMGQGVVPVVTAVRSGVAEWVRDGDNGIAVPVGDMQQMAAKLAALHADRPALAAMKQRAWHTLSASGLSISATADAYARIFSAALARPIDPKPTDTGLHPVDLWRWNKGGSASDPAGADAWCTRLLQSAGYRSIALNAPAPGCDAVLIGSSHAEPVPAADIRAWRAAGLGVAVSPHLRQDALAARVLDLLRAAVARGRSRIAIYPAGRHTRRFAQIFNPALWAPVGGSPFVGFLDDAARPGQHAFGLPVVHPDHALDLLAPDAILLSSDAFEPALWERTAPLRDRGVEVLRVYSPPHSPSEVSLKPADTRTLDAHGESVHAHRAR